jgi:Zn-dependent protease with chaperone function
MRETKMAYFPKDDGEYIGIKEGYINDRMKAIGLTVSLNVLKQGVVTDENMTKKLNVIANILNRQTWDYDVTFRVWIIKDDEPVAYSGPCGYIFVSNTLLEVLTDYKELVAVIGHEIGHIAMRHGIKDLALEQARYSAEQAFEELDSHMDKDTLEISEDLDEIMKTAMEACALVRDDKEEYEADAISKELLRRYKIDSKYLINALKKISFELGSKYPQYKKQIQKRIKKLKRGK